MTKTAPSRRKAGVMQALLTGPRSSSTRRDQERRLSPPRVALTGQSGTTEGNTVVLIIIRHSTKKTARNTQETASHSGESARTQHTHTGVPSHTHDRTRFLSLQDSRIAAAVVVTVVLHSAAVLFTSPPRRHAHRTNVHSLGRGIRLLAGCGHECRRLEELSREGRVAVLRTQSVRDHDGCGGISGRVRHPQNSSFREGAPDAR